MHPAVAAALAKQVIPYKVRRHCDCKGPVRTPADFARELNLDIRRITKTLLLRSVSGSDYAVAVAPVSNKINFAAIAHETGVQKIEVASLSELASVTGYPPTGVSPLGLSGIPVIVDQGLIDFPSILIGAGLPGVEIEVSPTDLITLTAGRVIHISI